MGIPCMTLRNSTERPETISLGTNELVGIVPDNLLPYLNTLLKEVEKGKVPPLWDGYAGERIVGHLEEILFC